MNRLIFPAPGSVLRAGTLGLDAGKSKVRIELQDHGVQVANVGSDLQRPGAKGLGLAGQLGAALREASQERSRSLDCPCVWRTIIHLTLTI